MLLAILLYFKAKKTKSPRYAKRSMNIVRDLASKIESLELSYRGKKIETATVTRVLFWNAGRETIHRADIAEADPLIITTKEGCEILDARVTQMKKPANLFNAVLGEGSKVRIGFDYIDKNEGAVIQLIHTGRSSDDIQVLGTIKGAGRPVYRPAPAPTSLFPSDSLSRLLRPRMRCVGIAMILAGVAFSMMILSLRLPFTTSLNTADYSAIFTASLFAILYCGSGASLLIRRIPAGFDAFETEF